MENLKKYIAIYNTSLEIGGISKSLINLLQSNYLNEFEIDVFLLEDKNEFMVYDFPLNVHIYPVPVKLSPVVHYIPFNILKLLKKDILNDKEYEYVIDYNGYSNECAYLALNTKGKKHVIWIHNDFYKRYKYNVKFKYIWKMMKSKYEKFDRLVAVSKGAADGFRKIYKKQKLRIEIIPNIIDVNEIFELSKGKIYLDNKEKYCLVSVGRLCKAKNIEKQIQIMAEVRKYREDIQLFIIGDGPERKKLEKLVKEKEIEDNVFFLGKQTNPYKYMRKMDGLIFTSLYEGQGMVVREAEALGLDLFIDTQLKDYNEGIAVSFDMVNDIRYVLKKEKKLNYMADYHNNIKGRLKETFK